MVYFYVFGQQTENKRFWTEWLQCNFHKNDLGNIVKQEIVPYVIFKIVKR
jgi:hypothetical protein